MLNGTAFERYGSILPWICTWIGLNNIEPLNPEGWFEEVHGFNRGNNIDNSIWMPYHSKGSFLWVPAPSVEDLLLSQLGEAVHKRANRLHVFICTKLMMPVWGRLLFKMADLVVYGPPEAKFWPSSMYESFVLGLFSPSSHTGIGGSGVHPKFW